MIRRWSCGLVLLATAFAASGASPPPGSVFDHPATAAQLERDLRAVTLTLREAQTLRGRYVQKKTLREIPRPLVAEGRYVFARDLGIAWRTLTPFATDLVITRNAIVQREGNMATRLTAEQQPGVRAVASVFFAVFALDFSALETLFHLHSRRTARGWELGLLPRPGIGDGVRSIVVSGRAHVERVVLLDRGGDLTDIQLRDTRASREPLTADERPLFAD